MNQFKKCLQLWILIVFVISISESAVAKKGGKSDSINLTFPNCGKRSPRIKKRELTSYFHPASRVQRWNQVNQPAIISGQEARAHSWPWMAALFFVNDDGKKQFNCGGSLISRRYVLTAAHCFQPWGKNIDPSKFVVFLGSHVRDDGTEYKLKSILVHPGYKFEKSEFYHDLTLLKTSKKVELTSKVFPVCLPSKGGLGDRVQERKLVTITGWGKTDQGSTSFPAELREVTLNTMSWQECDKKYDEMDASLEADRFSEVTEDQICTREMRDREDTCQGDSGGPLVSKLKGDDYTYAQIGVVSYGYGCGNPSYPGVNIRLSRYTKWLYDNTDLGR